MRRFTLFVSAVSLALNVAEPVLSGDYGKAAFDAVGPMLLIGWAEVGPQVLQALARIEAPAVSTVERQLTDGQGEPAAGCTDDDLFRARQADARHWVRHRRPISADALRRELEIGADRARELVEVVRSEVAAKVCAAV